VSSPPSRTSTTERNALFHQLLQSFEQKTGCPVLINTSFNVRGEPIVGTPADAYRCFLATDIDVLALGRCVLHKAGQRALSSAEVEAHLAQFQLD
jgi:carbamoyltransferase